MTQGNIEFDLKNGLFTYPVTSVPIDLEKIRDANGALLTIRSYGTDIPTDGTAGYAPACIFQDIDSGVVHINEGSATSCDFDAITTA